MSGWRVVVVASRAKLELKLNTLVVRTVKDVSKVSLDEIDTLVVENTGISITGALLLELSRKKVNIIFCDNRHLPYGQLLPFCGSHDSSAKIHTQIEWTTETKNRVWAYIVKSKIQKQAECLRSRSPADSSRLLSYHEQVEDGDSTNREGHAAKVYFNALFGDDFSRSDDSKLNSALDYGYSIIMSAVAREIVANGYVVQLGIFHHNVFNGYNLACDLMEPFRPIVDDKVSGMNLCGIFLETEEKRQLVNLVNENIIIDGKQTNLLYGIRIYVKSVLDALASRDVDKIKSYFYGF